MRRCEIAIRNTALLALLAVSMPAPILRGEEAPVPPPDISFHGISDKNKKDCQQLVAELAPSDIPPSDEYYGCKIDFARLEHELPLSQDDLKKITFNPNNLKVLTQEQVDQIYARLKAGPLPQGEYKIEVFDDLPGSAPFKEFGQLAGEKGQGLALLLSQITLKEFETVWRAKVFSRSQTMNSQGVVRTRIGDPRSLPEKLRKLLLSKVGDMKNLPLDKPLFPAKVYCGQSLLDGRRESIIIDYAFSHDLDGYTKEIDWLMGPSGLQVRDEMRMVRPGFYLGRVYMGRIFVLNMILYNEDLAKQDIPPTGQDCWGGTQQVAVGPK